MIEERRTLSVAQLKTEARQYQAKIQQSGDDVSHAAALEHVAKRRGFRDWNTACAILNNEGRHLSLGQRVSGRYLGHAFKGVVRGLQRLSSRETRVDVEFDAPVDVDRFASFSALRKRVRGVVRKDGTSAAKISTGAPHLVIDQMKPKSQRAGHSE